MPRIAQPNLNRISARFTASESQPAPSGPRGRRFSEASGDEFYFEDIFGEEPAGEPSGGGFDFNTFLGNATRVGDTVAKFLRPQAAAPASAPPPRRGDDKLLIYGGIGLAVVVVLALLFRK